MISYVRDDILHTVLVVVFLGFNTPFLTMIVLPLSQFLVAYDEQTVLCLSLPQRIRKTG